MGSNFFSDSDEIKILWKGIVKIDQSITDWLDSPQYQNNHKFYSIRDTKFHYADNAQFDNPDLAKDYPNDVTVLLKEEEITEFMECSVFIGYREISEKTFFNKSGLKKRPFLKGFILEPLADAVISEHACLASFRFDNLSSDNETVYQLDTVMLRQSLAIKKLGCVAISSGSQGSNITFAKDQKKSVSIFFVASNEKPFVARIDTNQGKRLVSCNSLGFRIDPIEKTSYGTQKPEDSTEKSAETLESLKILNNRLAKGEITIYEYENIRRTIESRVGQSSANWWT